MSLRGYSFRLFKANRTADLTNPGVQLGRYCIERDISVQEVAEMFGVSRQTIYSWFVGAAVPHKTKAEKIQALLKKARNSR